MVSGDGPRQGCRSRMDHASIARLVASGSVGPPRTWVPDTVMVVNRRRDLGVAASARCRRMRPRCRARRFGWQRYRWLWLAGDCQEPAQHRASLTEATTGSLPLLSRRWRNSRIARALARPSARRSLSVLATLMLACTDLPKVVHPWGERSAMDVVHRDFGMSDSEEVDDRSFRCFLPGRTRAAEPPVLRQARVRCCSRVETIAAVVTRTATSSDGGAYGW
jgi:hypothetical protein